MRAGEAPPAADAATAAGGGGGGGVSVVVAVVDGGLRCVVVCSLGESDDSAGTSIPPKRSRNKRAYFRTLQGLVLWLLDEGSGHLREFQQGGRWQVLNHKTDIEGR